MFPGCMFFSLVALASSANSVKRPYQCGNQSYFTADNGIIRSHSGYNLGNDYGKNMDCVWTIEAPEEHMVELVANTFHVAFSSGRCWYDYLELFDGNTTNRPSLGKFCGDAFVPISSTQRFLTLNFVTDSRTDYRGFELFYSFTDHVIRNCLNNKFLCANLRCVPDVYQCDGQDDCGDASDEMNCRYGTQKSAIMVLSNVGIGSAYRAGGCVTVTTTVGTCPTRPDVLAILPTRVGKPTSREPRVSSAAQTSPLHYPNNSNCTYHVTAPEGTKTIAFTFDNRFSIESSVYTKCTFDNVIISGTHGQQMHGPFCGMEPPSHLKSMATRRKSGFNRIVQLN